MISRQGKRNVKMSTTNKKSTNKKRKIISDSTDLGQTFSTATNLPSISNILTSDTSVDVEENQSGQHLFPEGRYVTRSEKLQPFQRREIPAISPSSSPSLEPVTDLKDNLAAEQSTPHGRKSSLHSLMNESEKEEKLDAILQEKVTGLQNITNLITEHINVLEQNGGNGNIHINDTNTYETLRKVQNLSIYLHDIVSEMLNSQRMKLIKSDSTISQSPIMSPVNTNIPTTPTPKSTLLPPLQIQESSKDARRFSAFKFPDVNSNIKPSVRLGNGISCILNITTPKSATGETIITHPTRPNQPLQSVSRNNSLQTPRENYTTTLSPLLNEQQQPNVMEMGKLNKVGNSFTMFPKSNDQSEGKSTIITPVSHNKSTNDPSRSHDRNTLVIPPLNYHHGPSTITPNSSREENKIIPEIEEGSSLISPTNMKRGKTSPTSKILTSKSGATIGMTKTLKLTNNSLLEKPFNKKSKEKEKIHPEESRSHHLETISRSAPLEKNGQVLKLQEQEIVEPQELENESNKKCFHCQSSKTPEWRAGPYGGENICNACGLFYRKIISKFGEKGGNLLMKYRQLVCPRNRRVPAYIEIPEEYMIKFSKEAGFDQFGT